MGCALFEEVLGWGGEGGSSPPWSKNSSFEGEEGTDEPVHASPTSAPGSFRRSGRQSVSRVRALPQKAGNARFWGILARLGYKRRGCQRSG